METSDDVKFRIEAALRRVITDIVGRFDECLVDKLFESIKKHRILDIESKWVPLEFEHYKDMNGSVNLARLLKYHSSVSSAGPLLDFSVLTAFVHCLPQIVLRDKPPEITPALSHLLNIVSVEVDTEASYGFIQLIRETHYDAPFGIRNIIHLLKYLLETTKVYHIQNLAITIFHKLILGFSLRLEPECERTQIEVLIEETTIELLCEKNSRLVHLALLDLFENASKRSRDSKLDLIKSLQTIVKCRYQELLEQPNISKPNFDLLVKCVSYTDTHPNIEIVEQLMARDNLDAIIMYVTSSNWKPFTGQHRWLGVFILYPLLARCHSDSAQVLTEMLRVSSEEKSFIQRNLKDKHVLQCLTYLHQTKNHLELIESEWMIRTLKIALEYLKYNINSSEDLKNLSLCCLIMRYHSMKMRESNSDWLKELAASLLNVLNQIDYNSFPNKPIFLHMLQLLARTCDTRTYLEDYQVNFNKLIEMAFKVRDPDILDEFTQIYLGIERFMIVSEDVVSHEYSELIWNHILPIARGTNHHNLLANAASLLIILDSKSKVGAMQVDLPTTIGDLLSENSHVYTITEKIIECLIRTRYLKHLSIRMSGQTDNCDHIHRGICDVLRSDGLTGNAELFAYTLIDETIRSIAISDDLSKWERLARMGAFDLLHKIHSCSAYEEGSEMKIETKQRCYELRKHLSMTGAEFQEFIKPHTTRAKELARLFTSVEFKEPSMHSGGQQVEQDAPSSPMRADHNLDKLGLNSYLDDILNDDLISHMAECY